MIATANNRLRRLPARACPPRDLAAALRAVWQDCWRAADGGDVARALTNNLVVAVPAEDEASGRDAIERVFPRTPCRAFLFLVSREDRPIEAELSVVTRRHGGVHDIVLEEVVVRMPKARLGGLPGLVRPLLMNDLPSHLYWRLDWPHDAVFGRALQELCDHVIVDSTHAVDAQAAVTRAGEWRRHGRRVTDLSWLRARPWRRALAEAFERIPYDPAQPHRGTIRCGKPGLASALLLAQWLQARLGASVAVEVTDGREPDRLVLRSGEAEVSVESADEDLRIDVTTGSRCYLPCKQPASRGTEGDLLAAAVDVG
ncbi:MAG: hypothetical protein RL398_995 [Planctomycetota bacterium]